MAPNLDADEIETRIRLLLDQARAQGLSTLESIATPEFVREKSVGVTRTGQVLAFFLVAPVIMVSLRLIVVMNQLMTDILGVQTLGSQQDPIFAWIITALTGGLYVMAAWGWFQFVRSGAFGFLTWEDF